MNPYQLAKRFVGIKEIPGEKHSPAVVAFHQLGGSPWFDDDETPWCSSFVHFIASYCLGLVAPTKSKARARMWLTVGVPVDIQEAIRGHDLVILKRGTGVQPDETVTNAPGHVGFYVKHDGQFVWVLGGNQSNSVNIQRYLKSRVLGIRRLYAVEEV